jgi:hypothetical protein
LPEGASACQLHDDGNPPVIKVKAIVNDEQVWMPHRGHGARLAFESFREPAESRKISAQHFHSDLAIEAFLASAKDFTHATASE